MKELNDLQSKKDKLLIEAKKIEHEISSIKSKYRNSRKIELLNFLDKVTPHLFTYKHDLNNLFTKFIIINIEPDTWNKGYFGLLQIIIDTKQKEVRTNFMNLDYVLSSELPVSIYVKRKLLSHGLVSHKNIGRFKEPIEEIKTLLKYRKPYAYSSENKKDDLRRFAGIDSEKVLFNEIVRQIFKYRIQRGDKISTITE